jgi:hypothetical protein
MVERAHHLADMPDDPAVAAIRHLYHHSSATTDPAGCVTCRHAIALLKVPEQPDRDMLGRWLRAQSDGPRGRLRLLRNETEQPRQGTRWLNNLLRSEDAQTLV